MVFENTIKAVNHWHYNDRPNSSVFSFTKRTLYRVIKIALYNPLTTTAIQKLLEIIGRVRLCPSYSFATALDSDINQTAGSGGYLSM